jgi:molybdopterin synthase catalytic subunit
MIRLQAEDFDIGDEVGALLGKRKDVGAVVTFTGLVRDVEGLELEHYAAMAERELERIEQDAISRWQLQASLIIHRFGKLPAGAQIVLVVTAARHRAEAFAAAEFLMDYLKTRAPFWKREIVKGEARWVDAATKDEEAASRWNKD